ncbi:type VI secretion system baseplate subunit TssG [Maridesulfovibrio hydrothermalis]|uniref:Type VI secretion protein, VC_A0111 family n=1 Tax=Maridesulfovibrio hydrothermalis AM13 = DSM 14728 TaxID=1121451 RepID=L0RD56_9BACT|nr:type VI secretion system baseplate subunit TssG [Maridesulfovibrio hydrothermalis]CCO24157.1 Type VI secretion protein, VC_A0111 family [Maridesulfovibrio hydrothermalis AM13 = DSM 14728]
MECDDRRSSASVTGRLLDNPEEYSFFQAIRLLRLHSGACTGKDLETFFRDYLRVRPQLSLGFPATDLTDLEEEALEDGDRYRLETTFMGLYGASSPLPVFYTEELLTEASDDKSVTRDFIDIINNGVYVQFFKAWSRSRLMIKAVDERDSSWLERLNCLLGLGHKENLAVIPEECRRYRHIGLLTQYPRSALGLNTLLKDSLQHNNVRVEQCVLRKVKLPEDQRFSLGVSSNVLGEESLVGEELEDRTSKCAIVIRDLDAARYHQLLPGDGDGEVLDNLVRGYLVEPFKYDLILEMRPGEAKTAVLGGDQWSGLGCDTWIFSGGHLEHAAATFPNEGGHVHSADSTL